MSRAKTSFGGESLEAVIRALQMRDFTLASYQEFTEAKRTFFHEPRWLVERYPYKTLFGTQGRREYWISSNEWTGQLECKFQNVSGSVDEKMVYLSETLRRSGEERLAVVYGGAYWKDKRGARVIEWMRNESLSLKRCGKELLILNLDQFIGWCCKTWK